ncbi:MAG: hypothetical protein WAV05_11220 [Anaerolineales bacterium]
MEFGIDLFDGFGNLVIDTGTGRGDEELGLDDTGDGGGSQAEGAEDIGELVGIGFGTNGFEETAGEEADEGDLFDQAGGVGGFDSVEVTLAETAGVEAMLEGIEVAFGGTTVAGGGGVGGHGGKRER